MIDLYYWPTPNGHKITLFLEEVAIPYRIVPVNIGKGDQFKPDFLQISPNNRMPAIVDHEPQGGGEPVSVFESGAILVYLAEKTGRFLPTTLRERAVVLEWLFWQVGGLGPMAGQSGHFSHYAAEKIPYAIDRYKTETGRLCRVLNDHLRDRPYIAPDYSIADMAAYPWAVDYARLGPPEAKVPHLQRWLDRIAARPATVRAYEKGKALASTAPMSEDAKKILFGQK